MKEDHYILTLNKDLVDVGFYYAALLPMSASPSEDYGSYAWYAGPDRWEQQIPEINVPLKLSMKKNYSYDVRGGSWYFYVISDKFLSAISDLKTSFKQIIPIECVEVNKRKLSGEKLYAAVPRKFFEKEVLVSGGGILKIDPNFDYDLFDVKDVDIHIATLICTEKARAALIAAGISTISFIPISQVKYPNPIKSYDALNSCNDYMPV